MGMPHFASPVGCDCGGCRDQQDDHKHHKPPLPPLPPLSETAILPRAEVVKRDAPVLELFLDSYLAPLLPMARSQVSCPDLNPRRFSCHVGPWICQTGSHTLQPCCC